MLVIFRHIGWISSGLKCHLTCFKLFKEPKSAMWIFNIWSDIKYDHFGQFLGRICVINMFSNHKKKLTDVAH